MPLFTALMLAVLTVGAHEDKSCMPAFPRGVQADSLLVEIVLSTTQEHIIVEAVLEADSALILPAGQVGALLGTSFPASRVTLKELQTAYPTVAFAWVPLEGRLYVVDRSEVLPASRHAKAEVVARMQNSFSLPVQSGPFAALAVDDSLHTMLDAGYSYRGRVAVAGRIDDTKAGSWGATLAPNSHVFVSYTDAVARPPTTSGRLAAGPLWFSASYTPHSPVEMSGLFRVGDVQVFASKQYGVLTINRPSQVAFQLATNWEQHRTAAQISVGPSYASPFSFPTTTLDRRSK